jgi:hypothetical protein
MAATAVVTDENCGDGAGAIDMTLTGGTAPFTYDWNGGTFTTEDLTALSAGTFTCIVTDANGCTYMHVETVINNTGNMAGSVTLSSDTCNSGVGSIDLTASGGVSPYSFLWSNGETTEDVSNLTAGIYSVTVTDFTGCQLTVTDTVPNIDIPVDIWAVNITDATCSTCPDGIINISLTVNGNPYTFAWSNGETTEDISNALPGTHTLSVTNVHGCTLDTTFTVGTFIGVAEPNVLELSVYPNPSNGEFNIEFDNSLTGDLEVIVFDGIGKVVFDNTFEASELNGKATIDLRAVERGTYIMQVKAVSGSSIHRVVIMH